ncbi:hypothetical protein NXX60_00295 [Bacteroides thetaiotaomicron]|nr:hypothetical protein NXX60_00295 [Bacteroides thetaiotaomicron]
MLPKLPVILPLLKPLKPLAKAKEAEAVAKAAEDNAIRAAIEKVTELQGLLQASIDGKVDQSVYDLAMVAVAGQIKGIREDLNTLTTTGQVAQNAADIKTAQEAIATLMAAYENLKPPVKCFTRI